MDINAFWHAVLSQDREALRCYFCDNAVIRWHCTNECFTAAEYIRANCDYPGDWDGTLERVEEAGNTVVLAGHVLSADKRTSCHVVSFIRLRDGKISEMDEYWADDGDAPDWRRKMEIGKPIR